MSIRYRLTFVLCLLFSGMTLQGQFGGGLRYGDAIQSGIANFFEEQGTQFPSATLGAHLNYWLRLKSARVEFLPELGYEFGSADGGVYETSFQALSTGINVDIYLFDFLGDCDCPTFSKQGTEFQKSFFLEIYAGADVQFLDLSTTVAESGDFNDAAMSLRIGGGFGFDIGLSDLVTLTPVAGIYYRSPADWSDLHTYFMQPDLIDQPNDVLFKVGLRVLFRPDYLRRYR